MTAKRVLSVGQCAADHSRISRTLHLAFNAEVVGVDTMLEAVEKLRHEPFALVLVNRVFDADEASGLDFIKQLKIDTDLQALPIMLVSNYEEAQVQAVEAGALPGFGKAALEAPQTSARLKSLLGN